MIVFRMQHYEPMEYLRQMTSLYQKISGLKATWKRVQHGSFASRVLNAARAISARLQMGRLSRLEHLAANDRSVRSFYSGASKEVPRPFVEILKARLGPLFRITRSAKFNQKLVGKGAAPEIVVAYEVHDEAVA